MPKEYSPFTPGVPVPLELFVGRSGEIQQFIEAVNRSVALKTVERLFIAGERGIGKSSICRFALTLAERNHRVLGIHVFLGGVESLEEMVRRIFERLLRASAATPWFSRVKNFLGNHIKQLDIFGLTVEFSATEQELTRAVNDFIPTMENLLKQFEGEKSGILLILDDINGLAAFPRFANWFKSVVDELATAAHPLPLTIALVGLPERRAQMVAHQPSLDRVFTIIPISRFNEQETSDFFKRAFSRVQTDVREEALRVLWRFSGGYPVFMHELGDAVFKVDDDNVIDERDAFMGVIRGANVIGEKYVEPKILEALRSAKYRNILKKISKKPFEHRFARKEAVARFTGAEAKVFDNFLRRMESLGAIRKYRDHGPGHYEFTNELYYLFFWLQATAEARS